MPNLANGLAQPYLQNALVGGTIVAILTAFVGYFVVVRGASFATHALSQIGFAGAAGAALVGIAPLVGLIAFAIGGALLLGVLAARTRSSDVTTALVLVAALGTGALFLALQRDYASNAFSLLFGTIVGVDRTQVATTAVVAIVAISALGFIGRPLLYSTVARDVAASAGVPVALLDLAFLVIIALACAVTVPIVGTLLVFSLTIGPAAAASRLAIRPAAIVAIATVLGISAVLFGIAFAYLTDWPIGFYVATLTTLQYVAARFYARRRLERA